MLFKRILNIFGTNNFQKTKKGKKTCTECEYVYDKLLDECPNCKYLKILTDNSFDEKSDNLKVVRTIRGETAIKVAKHMGLKLLELRA